VDPSEVPLDLGKSEDMLYYSQVFFFLTLIAALFAFDDVAAVALDGIAAGVAEIAEILFFIFLLLFVVSLIVGLFRPRRGLTIIGRRTLARPARERPFA